MSDLKSMLGLEYRDTLGYAAKVSRYGLEKMPPLIISCAMTGSAQGAEVNPALPETAKDQIQSAYEAYNAGAALVHIHARDPQNLGYLAKHPEDFLEVNRGIREKCPDIIINNTCGALRNLNYKDMTIGPQGLVSLDALPEVATIDVESNEYIAPLKARKPPLTGRDEDVVWELPVFISHKDCENVLDMMDERNIKPEWECFNLANLKMINTMIKRGKTKGPHWISFLFNGIGFYPSIDYMMLVTRHLPEDSMMNVIGIGAAQTAMLTLGILMGHHVRVGLEDNCYYSGGELAKSNAQLVERIVRIAKELGRPIATPAQAREMLGLGAPRQY